MDEIIACPRCSNESSARAGNLEWVWTCPACRHEREAIVPRGRAVEYRLNLDEVHHPWVKDAGQASRELERWKEAMPKVEPAYQASGRMPPGAGMFLAGGAALGAIAGPATALVISALTGGVIQLIARSIDAPGAVLWFGAILGLIGSAAAFFLMGVVAGLCTGWAGKRAKNRDAGAAAWFAFASAGVGLAVLAAVAWFANARYLHREIPMVRDMTLLETLFSAGAVLGALTALVTATNLGWRYVQLCKYCEDCEAYMKPAPARGLRLGRLRAVARALADGQFDAAAEMTRGQHGSDGTAKLWRCPCCGVGFLDVHADFKATWKDYGNNEVEVGKQVEMHQHEEWLVASVALTREQADRFASEK